jgi:hypothetical protein
MYVETIKFDFIKLAKYFYSQPSYLRDERGLVRPSGDATILRIMILSTLSIIYLKATVKMSNSISIKLHIFTSIG